MRGGRANLCLTEICSITPEVNQHNYGYKWGLWLMLLDSFVGKRVICVAWHLGESHSCLPTSASYLSFFLSFCEPSETPGTGL